MKKKHKANLLDLTGENRKIVYKIERYLETHYVNTVSKEETISDLTGMALECQQRGENFSDAIGDAHKFSREVALSSPRQSMIERILSFLVWPVVYSMLLLPATFLFELFFGGYTASQIDGILIKIPLATILNYFIVLETTVIGFYIVRMQTYKPIRYVMVTYVVTIMLLYIFADRILHYIIGNRVVTLRLDTWLIAHIVLLILIFAVGRLEALTVAYKSRRNKKTEEGNNE